MAGNSGGLRHFLLSNCIRSLRDVLIKILLPARTIGKGIKDEKARSVIHVLEGFSYHPMLRLLKIDTSLRQEPDSSAFDIGLMPNGVQRRYNRYVERCIDISIDSYSRFPTRDKANVFSENRLAIASITLMLKCFL